MGSSSQSLCPGSPDIYMSHKQIIEHGRGEFKALNLRMIPNSQILKMLQKIQIKYINKHQEVSTFEGLNSTNYI